MINKIKKILKDNFIILLTIITGLTIVSLIYYLQDIAPFGENSLLQIDFYHQYGPMLGEFFDRIKNGLSLIYSFYSGLGLPFFRNFLNYLSSPFNLIILLFKRSDLLMSFSIIIGLRTVVAATTMVYFLSKKFNYKNLAFIPLSILYGFCAYFTAYYWNIMWLDGMVFLPLIVLGIENIINKDKCTLYIISLAIMLISNYFIAFMICFFSVLYFITYLVINTEKFEIKIIFKKILNFGVSSLLAAGLTAILLIPLYYGINSISATSDSWPQSQYYAFTFWEFLANHFSGVGSTILASGVSNAANISTGILSIALLFLFVVNPKIKIKIKISYILLLLFFVLSFFYAPLDFIWHAFHVPNDLPYRYSFLYSFVLIIICAYSLFNIKIIKIKMVSIIYVLLLVGISLLYFLKYDNINNSMIILNILIITLYYILFILYKIYPKTIKKIPYLMILIVTLECSISINNNWDISQNIDHFYNEYDTTKKALDIIKNHDANMMYRIEKTSRLTLNDPSWYGYYGQMTFSSMAYEDLSKLQNNLGMPGNNINSYYYKQNTPVYDLMFNINYFFGNTWDINRYKLYYHEDGHLIFKSNFDTNLIYAVNKEIHNWEFYNNNPFYIQNDFIEKSTGIENVFIESKFNNKEIVYDKDNNQIYKYTFNNPMDNMYFYIRDNIDFIIINDTLYYHNNDFSYAEKAKNVDVFDFKNLDENFIISSRTDDETYDVYIGYNNYSYDDFYSYYINNDSFKLATSVLNENKFSINSFKENLIEGKIKLESEKSIFTSIPYDRGWKVYANGELIDTFEIGNSLLGFELNKGTFDITLKFIPYGMKIGGAISIFSFLVISTIYLYKKKKS